MKGNGLVDEIWKMKAVDVRDLLRRRELSAAEVLENSISRVEAIDKNINALPERCFDRARQLAIHIDKNPSSEPCNLNGLPIAVKDYNDLSSVKTTYGSPLFLDNVAQCSDRTITILEKNGANSIAKSNVPEWAGGHTFNPVYGLTRNPWNTTKTAGGSSGGSAAALASGQVFLATGNDLGGSLRTPAAFTGVVGLRPSPGLVPRGSRYMPFDTLWVEGPMARSVEDVAMMLDAMVGHDRNDPLSYESTTGSFLEAARIDYVPKSVAFSEDLGVVPVEDNIRYGFRNAMEKISKFDWDISEDIPSFDGALDGFKTLRGLLMACMLGDLVEAHGDRVLVDIRNNVQAGYELKSFDIIRAEKIRQKLLLNIEKFLKNTIF